MAKNQGVASMLAMALLLAAIPTGIYIYCTIYLVVLPARVYLKKIHALHHVHACIYTVYY
jgi:hypothetical protein